MSQRSHSRPRQPPGHRAAPRRAVTIIELIVVIMVMAIMAAVAAPAFFETLLHHRVESAARRVKADLDLARHVARLKSASQSVAFTASGYSLSAAVNALDDPVQVYSVDLTAAPYELSTVTANFDNSTSVSFDGHGAPSSGGDVVLVSKGHRCTVTLDEATGEITINSQHVRGAPAVVDAN